MLSANLEHLAAMDAGASDAAPGPEALFQMLTGGFVAQAISTAARIGVFEHLGGEPRAIATLATELSCHEESLYRLLRALAGLGFVSEIRPRHFRALPFANWLRSDTSGSLRSMAILMGDDPVFRPLGLMHVGVRTGETPFQRLHAMNLFDYLSRNAEASRLFSRAVSEHSGPQHNAIVDAYDFSTLRSLVDIGGGEGQLLAQVLQRTPGLHGVLFDQPRVVSGAEALLSEAGVRGRCEIAAGDFFRAIPSGHDGYLLTHVLHDWPEAEALAILLIVRRAMPAHGRLFIGEMLIPEGDAMHAARVMDLIMLCITGGRERTEAEYRELLDAAGFELERVTPTRSPISVLEARPV